MPVVFVTDYNYSGDIFAEKFDEYWSKYLKLLDLAKQLYGNLEVHRELLNKGLKSYLPYLVVELLVCAAPVLLPYVSKFDKITITYFAGIELRKQDKIPLMGVYCFEETKTTRTYTCSEFVQKKVWLCYLDPTPTFYVVVPVQDVLRLCGLDKKYKPTSIVFGASHYFWISLPLKPFGQEFTDHVIAAAVERTLSRILLCDSADAEKIISTVEELLIKEEREVVHTIYKVYKTLADLALEMYREAKKKILELCCAEE